MIHLIVWAFKITFKCLGYIFAGGFILVALFLLLCMNVFTVPIYLICLLFSKLLKTNTPHVRFYGTMLYPSWSDKPGRTFWGDIKDIKKKSDKKAKAKKPIRAWEERFF